MMNTALRWLVSGIVFFAVVLTVPPARSAAAPGAEELLTRSIAYHDPGTRLDRSVKRVEFEGRKVFALRVARRTRT